MAEAKKRQKFFDVEMPILKKETQLYGYDLEDFKEKFIIYDLTRALKGKNMLMKLKVNLISNNGSMKAIAEPVEIIILPYYIRRMMRKGVNYVEDSFNTECKNALLRVKPFLITRKKVARSVRKALREKAKEQLVNYVKDKNSNSIFEDILKNKIQKSLSLILKKVYPLSLCEIRVLKVEKEITKEKQDKEV